MKSVQINVLGKVQGVWFRASTRNRAKELQLSGYVMNMEDASVFIEVHGSKEKVDALIEWCKQGPPHARVEEVKVKVISFAECNGFYIKR